MSIEQLEQQVHQARDQAKQEYKKYRENQMHGTAYYQAWERYTALDRELFKAQADAEYDAEHADDQPE